MTTSCMYLRAHSLALSQAVEADEQFVKSTKPTEDRQKAGQVATLKT